MMLALLGPGAVAFFWGLSSCAAAHHFGMPGAMGVFIGLGLIIAGGYYHYRTEYKGVPGKRALAAFTGLAAFSALIAYLVNRQLFR
jgi:hypothetical protein